MTDSRLEQMLSRVDEIQALPSTADGHILTIADMLRVCEQELVKDGAAGDEQRRAWQILGIARLGIREAASYAQQRDEFLAEVTAFQAGIDYRVDELAAQRDQIKALWAEVERLRAGLSDARREVVRTKHYVDIGAREPALGCLGMALVGIDRLQPKSGEEGGE